MSFFPFVISRLFLINEKKVRKETHPSLAGAGLAAVDHILNGEVGHREGPGAAADVVAVGEGGGRGCYYFFFCQTGELFSSSLSLLFQNF